MARICDHSVVVIPLLRALSLDLLKVVDKCEEESFLHLVANDGHGFELGDGITLQEHGVLVKHVGFWLREENLHRLDESAPDLVTVGRVDLG